jgi:hypothetical protein
MTAFSFDLTIAALASTQEWVFNREQAEGLGATEVMMWRRIRTGRWEVVGIGVYRLAGHPTSWAQRLWIARLTAGVESMVSHQAAGAIYRIPSYVEGPVVLLTPHGSHHRVPGAIIHQTRDPWPVSSQRIGGQLVTSPARTLIDLAGINERRVRLKLALNELVVTKQTSFEEIRDELVALARRGKRGMPLLLSVLNEYQGKPVPQSLLESELFALFSRFGGPAPVPQCPYPCRETVSGCADGGYPEALMAVETDGRTWHTRVQDIQRDHERDADAARNGWLVLRFFHEHVVGAPRQTWQTIQDTRRMRLAQFGHAA